MPNGLPQKVRDQMTKAGLPQAGAVPFTPRLVKNRQDEEIIEKAEVQHGPKQGKRGYVDTQGRIWIKDRAHGDVPDHWDVQLPDGADYVRVDGDGNMV
ncbi:MAG TPA: polymorphic toxin type 17 domain-containing protein [Planctomycetaceae bacterium]|nr:polymorphic toxin type 17 domain-containing protein [Planctomycetaceae bacterium]